MFHRLEQSHDHVIGYSLTGDVTEDEYAQVTSELRDDVARHGKVRLLLRLSDLLSLASLFSALDDRFRFVKEHKDDVERVAIVTDDTATEMLAKLSEALPGIQSEIFSHDEESKAWAWLA